MSVALRSPLRLSSLAASTAVLTLLLANCSKDDAASDADRDPDGDANGASSGDGDTSTGANTSASGGIGATSTGGGGTSLGGNTPDVTGDELSAKYPGDIRIKDDPAVLFADNCEDGWGHWDAPSDDTTYLHMESDADAAHGGSGYLRSTVTTAHLDAQEYISASPRITFPERVDEVWWRFYAQFPQVAANPHHWVRLSAGTDAWSSSGLANTVPPGDGGFWFDFDASNDDVFNFYVYWHQMRSGRCNDGSATPGCEGDQGNTYHYGNVFRPPAQTPFPRGEWFCIEMHAKANTPGESDGALTFWIEDQLVGDYQQGTPDGTWLRDSFHTGGCEFSACVEPTPFEGFNFRTSEGVKFKELFLDAYYERGTSATKRAALEDRGLTVSDEQTILYDDIVVATQRIGCVR